MLPHHQTIAAINHIFERVAERSAVEHREAEVAFGQASTRENHRRMRCALARRTHARTRLAWARNVEAAS